MSSLPSWKRQAAVILVGTIGATLAQGGCILSQICTGDTDCAAGSFCKILKGNCENTNASGFCTVMPEACTLEYAPVCGCDGETYGNQCAADGAGVNVDHDGECGGQCGGLLGLACDDGEFCNYEEDALCGAADQTGVCEEIPEFCPEIFAPVCGCDGETYDNECFANAEGVSVASEGACDEIVIAECGGLQGLQCLEGEFCNYTDGSCGAADQLGVCAVIPEVCTDEFDPVCGCDDETYSNECEAAAAGVSVASEGECPQQ